MKGEPADEKTRRIHGIKTKRLLLRTLTRADAAAVRNVSGGEFKTEKDARKYIRWVHTVNRKPLFVFYIWLAQTGRCIGRVYIHSKPELGGEVEIGYGIAEEHRCNGYATEAARAAVRFAFEQAGLESLCAIVKPENIASLRVINKLGFTHCGVRTVLDENGVNCAFEYFKLYNS